MTSLDFLLRDSDATEPSKSRSIFPPSVFGKIADISGGGNPLMPCMKTCTVVGSHDDGFGIGRPTIQGSREQWTPA
jgi:hypothetical protein